MAKILECVPNISEGRNSEVIEAVVDVVRHTAGVALLDYSSDPSHNRTVITFLGEPQAVAQCAIDLAGKAVELIDLTKHQGEHPRHQKLHTREPYAIHPSGDGVNDQDVQRKYHGAGNHQQVARGDARSPFHAEKVSAHQRQHYPHPDLQPGAAPQEDAQHRHDDNVQGS